jgi:hypothetical protein
LSRRRPWLMTCESKEVVILRARRFHPKDLNGKIVRGPKVEVLQLSLPDSPSMRFS